MKILKIFKKKITCHIGKWDKKINKDTVYSLKINFVKNSELDFFTCKKHELNSFARYNQSETGTEILFLTSR